jgi:transposase InsO family protein
MGWLPAAQHQIAANVSFLLRIEAMNVIDQWRWHYNQVWPHSSLRHQAPAAFKKLCNSTTQPEAVFAE